MEVDEDDNSNISINYKFFKDKISESIDDILTIQKGIAKLFVVDIALNRSQDNPQLIFESMNST
ncbi:TPA: hypothetical protein DEP21_06045 [Patescibacteria group bacterium]|nr:hypothetical protein [Candidatus Gracilibacteria bacterium]